MLKIKVAWFFFWDTVYTFMLQVHQCGSGRHLVSE